VSITGHFLDESVSRRDPAESSDLPLVGEQRAAYDLVPSPEVVMRRLLYLDTARLGLPSGEVVRSLAALGAFISREGLSSRFDDLLRGGFEELPPAERRYYRGLSDWRGVAELRNTLTQLIGASPGSATVLASRTSRRGSGRPRSARSLVDACDGQASPALKLLSRPCVATGPEPIRPKSRQAGASSVRVSKDEGVLSLWQQNL
jgi:hypothetical protein